MKEGTPKERFSKIIQRFFCNAMMPIYQVKEVWSDLMKAGKMPLKTAMKGWDFRLELCTHLKVARTIADISGFR